MASAVTPKTSKPNGVSSHGVQRRTFVRLGTAANARQDSGETAADITRVVTSRLHRSYDRNPGTAIESG